jgi:shikimate dehydrogenase
MVLLPSLTMAHISSKGVSGRVALIGQPLKRRHSEIMHNAAFDHFGVESRYELRETPVSQLPDFFSEVRQGGWLGFQVTAPHKQAVIEFVDSITPAAEAIGAVNSGALLPDGSLEGFNTDAAGFAAALTEDLGATIDSSRIVVAGAGGAARAVVWALLTGGAEQVVIGNRQPQRAQALAADFAELGQVHGVDLQGSEFEAALGEADIAVNATTMGMTTDTMAFDPALLPGSAHVFDLVYVPLETPLVARARSLDLRVRNGLDMLVRQAEIAFERWTGITGSASVMHSALENWMAASTESRSSERA